MERFYKACCVAKAILGVLCVFGAFIFTVASSCGGGGDGSSGNDNGGSDNGGGNDKCLPGQGCAIFPDMNQPDQPKGCTFWDHECGDPWYLKWICEDGQCVPDPNECYLDEDCKEGNICALTKPQPQKCVDDSVLEPYRWVEGDWTCIEGAPEDIGKTKTVTILGWAGDDKGAEVSGFPSDDYSYVLKQKDGTFTYVGLNWKKEIGTSNSIFTMEGDDWSLEFDGWTVVPDGYHWKFVKE